MSNCKATYGGDTRTEFSVADIRGQWVKERADSINFHADQYPQVYLSNCQIEGNVSEVIELDTTSEIDNYITEKDKIVKVCNVSWENKSSSTDEGETQIIWTEGIKGNVGDTVVFDKNDDEWIIVEKNENDLVLMTKYITEAINEPARRFYSNSNTSVYSGWVASNARNWLNTTYYDKTFSDADKDIILDNETESGVIDKVYVFTKDEISALMTQKERQTWGTDKAYADGLDRSSTSEWSYKDGILCSPWALRSQAEGDNTKTDIVYSTGNWSTWGVGWNGVGFRPIIRVKRSVQQEVTVGKMYTRAELDEIIESLTSRIKELEDTAITV